MSNKSDAEDSLMDLQLDSPFNSSYESRPVEVDSTDSSSSSVSPSSSPRESEEKRCPTKLLPPCRVCGEPASGFHYGVNTCEACKGFFRRSIQRKKGYKCSGNDKCIIEPGKRSGCSHCRYMKCLAVGMSQNAIKTGRYTHAKRTMDIQEIKRIEGQRKIETVNDDDIDQEKIISAFEKYHIENPYYPPDVLEKLEEGQNQYIDGYELFRSLFGSENPFSISEYSDLYLQTGVDVDGRKTILQKWFPTIENNARKFIKFAKSIPGFKKLDLDDQMKVIKASRLEAQIISSFKGVNPTQNVFTTTSGDIYHMDEMKLITGEEIAETYFHLARKLHKMNLSQTELSLVKGIVILFADRVPLNNPSAVENLQRRLADILEQKVAQNHPDERQLFARILSFTCDLRDFKAKAEKFKPNFLKLIYTVNAEIPPLLVEVNTT